MPDTTPILPLALAALAAGGLSSAALWSYAVFSPRCQFFAPVLRGISQRDAVALTFDDGPDPEVTPRILDTLAAHNAKATFFVIGNHAQAHPALLRRIHDAGHALGNHSLDHHHFGVNRNRAYWTHQLETTQKIVADITGHPPFLFRPPMGFKTRALAAAAKELRLPIVGWSVRAYDTHPTPPELLTRRLLKHTAGHDIVLLHDGVDPHRKNAAPGAQKHTADALPAYLAGIAEKQLRILPLLDALLANSSVQSPA
jgi:peptidoglycan/xylan/chitin deacetylase (PgdA/CDA1 family)